MKNIIEKLGITKNPWSKGHGTIVTTVKKSKNHVGGFARICAVEQDNCKYGEFQANAQLIAAAPEMLEGYINILQLVEGVRNGNLTPDMFVNMVEGSALFRSEKATNKSWEEVKGLIDEN